MYSYRQTNKRTNVFEYFYKGIKILQAESVRKTRQHRPITHAVSRYRPRHFYKQTNNDSKAFEYSNNKHLERNMLDCHSKTASKTNQEYPSDSIKSDNGDTSAFEYSYKDYPEKLRTTTELY